MTHGWAAVIITLASISWVSAESTGPIVNTLRVPNEGIQPQIVVANNGMLHMIFFRGEAAAGDIYYVRSTDHGRSFSDPLRVNSQPGSAIATGTIRGAHLALGKQDRIHVAWNGSGKAEPRGLPNPQIPEDSPYRFSAPMLYTRMRDDGKGFETQRNLMTSTYSLDGGGSVAADQEGNVYVVWHANAENGAPGEGERAIWVAKSKDDGQTFAAEQPANDEATGACGCCGLRATVGPHGTLWVLYRSATNTVNRDMYLLRSRNQATSFETTKLDVWDIGQCVMSSAALHAMTDGVLAAWEADGQVKFARMHRSQSLGEQVVAEPDKTERARKHPVVCTNAKGQSLLAWTEGTGWQRGGSVAWQVFDDKGKPIAGSQGQAEGVPTWSNVAVFSTPEDGFTVVY